MRAIRHGKDLTPADVGPAAIGVAPARIEPNSRIREPRLPLSIVLKQDAATYDGQKILGPHYLLEDIRFLAPVLISARLPIVFRGVDFAPARTENICVYASPNTQPILFTHCRIEGPADGSAGLGLMLRAKGSHVHRCHITRVADGIRIAARTLRITETLIEDLVTRPGDHNDAVQVGNLGGELTLERCRILNRHPQTSCLYLIGEAMRVEACYLAGGGWTVYGGAGGNGKPQQPDARGVRITDCIFGRDYFAKCGHFGPLTYWPRDPNAGNVFARNRFDDGTAIVAPR